MLDRGGDAGVFPLEVYGFPLLSVPFPRNANPFQNSFLSIFKHNKMFTWPFTVFSQKLEGGFRVPRIRELK
jgi:hypothetical protein